MDSATRTALMNLTGELRLTNPAAANEVLNYLNGKGQLSASTLLLIRPRLLSQGVDIAALDKPASPLANEGIPDPLGTANNGKPFIQHDKQANPISYHSGVGGLNPGDIGGGGPLPVVPPAKGPGARDQNTQPEQVSGAPAPLVPSTPGAASTGGGGGTLPGNFTAGQGTILASPQGENQLQRFALQAAGLNPDRMGRFGQIIAGMLAPLIAARRNAFGIQGGQNAGGLPQDIVNFAKEFTTPGVDAFGHAQQYAQGILGSPEFRAYTGGLSNPDQAQAVYQSLMPLLFAGSNPLIQQSAADTAERTQNLYNDQTFANSGAAPNNGIFNDWLNANQQNFDPLQRRIFGLR